MATDPVTPLTPEEEAELRSWQERHRVRSIPIEFVDRLIATLDRDRAARDAEVTALRERITSALRAVSGPRPATLHDHDLCEGCREDAEDRLTAARALEAAAPASPAPTAAPHDPSRSEAAAPSSPAPASGEHRAADPGRDADVAEGGR